MFITNLHLTAEISTKIGMIFWFKLMLFNHSVQKKKNKTAEVLTVICFITLLTFFKSTSDSSFSSTKLL